MPSEGLASPSFAEFAQQFREGRVEPEIAPPTAPRTADPAAEISGMVPKIDTEPRLFDFVPREAPPTSVPSRRAPAERPHIGSVVYLLLVGLVAAATIGIFFGIAFFLLTQPKDKIFIGAGPVSPGVEEAVSTAKGTTRAGDATATIVASAQTAPMPGSGIGLAKPRWAATGGPESSRRGVRGAARRVKRRQTKRRSFGSSPRSIRSPLSAARPGGACGGG